MMVKNTMAERMATMENQIDNMEKLNLKHAEDNDKGFEMVLKKLENLENNLDTKFAGKWVEKISVGILISVIGGVAIYLITKGV